MLFSQNNLFAIFVFINECLDNSTEAIHQNVQLIKFISNVV